MQKISYENYANGEKIAIYNDRGLIRLEEFDPNTCDTDTITYKPIDYDGDTYISSSLQPRTITATIKIIGVDTDKKQYSRKAAINSYNKLLRAFVAGDIGRLVYNNNGQEYEIDCRLSSVPPYDSINQYVLSVNLTLIADNPIWYDTKENVINITSSEIKDIVNNSPIAVPFKLYVKGNNAQPWLLSVTANAGLAMFKGLENSQQHYIIDTCTCRLYDSDDDTEGVLANQFLNAEADFFYLLPGVNKIFFANWSSNYTVILTYKNGYLGV